MRLREDSVSEVRQNYNKVVRTLRMLLGTVPAEGGEQFEGPFPNRIVANPDYVSPSLEFDSEVPLIHPRGSVSYHRKLRNILEKALMGEDILPEHVTAFRVPDYFE